MASNIVPIIDISNLYSEDKSDRLEVATKIGQACRDIGFFVVVGHTVDTNLIDSTWQVTKNFFDLSIPEKMKMTADQNEYPFGYSELGGEVLSLGKDIEKVKTNGNNTQLNQLPDLKEMFAIGPKDPDAGFPQRRYPTEPHHFEQLWDQYYDNVENLGKLLLRAFALDLGLDEYFFENYVTHHASALRALNYPPVPIKSLRSNQLRASAHTDYGAITLLRVDGPGLQVSKDVAAPNWQDVPHVEGAFIINLGDLMKRWTNDQWLSTLHRVVIPELNQQSEANTATGTDTYSNRRQSMAFFFNVNKDSLINAIITNEGETAMYEPIIAGDFLMQKHLAATGAKK